MKPVSTKSIPGAFVNIDTSPRSGKNGVISVGGTPEKFEHYLRLQIERAERIYKTDMLFLFAWNEWAEGAYMEPDKRWEYGMLEAVRNALGTIK